MDRVNNSGMLHKIEKSRKFKGNPAVKGKVLVSVLRLCCQNIIDSAMPTFKKNRAGDGNVFITTTQMDCEDYN